jgi:hypothetical protein
MFNLERTISEWRRQMLAAGIQSPEPLEELEIHLREEIEQLTKSGLNEAEAFQAAVEIIGPARLLQKEFKKVAKDHTTIRAILLVIGWLAASCTLAYSMVGWDWDWNFFYFSPRWNLRVMVDLSGILVALPSMWFLAKASRDKTSRIAALLFCVLLAVNAVWCLPSEKIPAPRPVPALSPQMTDNQAIAAIGAIMVNTAIDRVFHRSEPSPIWYRGGRMLLLCVPGVFWVWWTRRHLTQKRSPAHGNLPIHSD